MRILVLSPYLPYPPHSGGRIRIFELLRFLQPRHAVTLVSFIFHEDELALVQELAKYCERVIAVLRKKPLVASDDPRPRRVAEFCTPEMQETLQALNAEARFDLVAVEHIFMAQYASMIAAPAILQEHNIESELLKRYARVAGQYKHSQPEVYTPSEQFRDARTEWVKTAAYEAAMWPRFAACTTVSDVDRDLLLARCPGRRVVTIPNGVDSTLLRPASSLEGTGILFTGGLFYQPNLDAAFELCDVIWPLVLERVPQACLYIVGREPPRELSIRSQAGRIEIIPDAPDLQPYAARCCLSVVPLRVGGGTRLKILTAMALGLPVVSTTIGYEGLELQAGRDLLVADDPAHFAESTVYLLQNKARRLALSRAGRLLVEEHYTWQRCFLQLEQLYEETATAGLPGG